MRLLACLVTAFLVMASLAAPVPTPLKKPLTKIVRADGPVSVDDLRKVKWLHWGEKKWSVSFETETSEGYICHHYDPENRTVWQGPCWLVGDELILEEKSYKLHPDSPPQWIGGPFDQRLKIQWKGGEIIGTGWGGPLKLEN